jgi:hypothetical protein
MKVKLEKGLCIAIKEKGDPKFSGVVNAAGESRLLYHIKKILNARGYDLIKKHMAKDGHLVSDMQQYLRTRKPTGNPNKDVYIYNGMWQIEGAEVEFNEKGRVTLSMLTNVFQPAPTVPSVILVP